MSPSDLTNESPTSSSAVQKLSEHVATKYVYDGKIIIYEVTDVRRESVDVWAKVAHDTLVNWSPDYPYLNLQDFSGVDNFAMTPYVRLRAEELMEPRPELLGRTAIVLKKSLGSRIVSMFIRAKKVKKARQRRLFFTQEDALAWLEEWLDPANIPSSL